jgi:hypothetical protein
MLEQPVMGDTPGTVYLLHFDRKIGNPDNPRAQAQHYIGWTSDLASRIASHLRAERPTPGRNGTFPAIVAAVNRAGIGWQVAATWPGTPLVERQMKRRKNAPRCCPICKGAPHG